MKKAIFILTLLFSMCLMAQTKYVIPADIKTLEESRAFLKEYTKNKVTEESAPKLIREMLYSVGVIDKNAHWCAALQYYAFRITGRKSPIKRTGLANGIYDDAEKRGEKSSYRPEVDDLIVWKFPNKRTGHIGRIVQVLKAGWVFTIEGNTTSNNKNVRTGGGVFEKRRNIYHPIAKMQVRGLIGFKI